MSRRRSLLAEYAAVVLTGGAEAPRGLPVPGRDLAGIHYAMEFLPQQNRVVAGDRVPDQILATDKHVVVIGGGDTGSDCVGTSNRQRAKSVTQFELLPQPPEHEDKPLIWPYWPVKLRTSSSHQEGCARDWAVATKRFEGRNGRVEKLVAARVEWQKDAAGQPKMVEMPGTEFEMKADLVLLAMGFLGPVQDGLLAQLGVERDARSNVRAGTRRLSDVGAEGLCGGRHAPRPVARGLGDPRRPAVRARGRPVPDGQHRTAPLIRSATSPNAVPALPDARRARYAPAMPPPENDVFLRALRREPTPYTPVWLMRQAGRYLPEYNATRAKAGSFLALAKTPSLATEVTLQPLARFPLDAAILFSDILTVPDAMGLGLYFADGEGPRFERTAADESSIARLEVPDMARLRYVFDAVREIKRALAGRVPLIGFAGQPVHARVLHDRRRGKPRLRGGAPHGPWPAGPAAASRRGERARGGGLPQRADRGGSRRGDALRYLGRTADGRSLPFVLARLDAIGARRAARRRRTGGASRRSCSRRAAGSGSTRSRPAAPTASGSTGPSISPPPAGASARSVALQGNLDPLVLLADASVVAREAAAVVRAAGPAPGHIFNLGHGIVPATPPENVAALVEAVHRESRASRAGA